MSHGDRLHGLWLALVVSVFLQFDHVHAQSVIVAPDVVATSPPSPVGAGARATGLASAFIAVADDATAASWNPGGLVQLERPELSLVGSATHQLDELGELEREDGESRSTFSVGENDTTTAALNYASAALPFSIRGSNVVVSMNYQAMLAFNRDANYQQTNTIPSFGLREDLEFEFEQRGSVYALSPAAAVEVATGLSFGATLNYWFDGLARNHAWRETFDRTGTLQIDDQVSDTSSFTEVTYRNFRGINGTLGLLWRHPSGLGLGLVAELPFTARFTLDRSIRSDSGSSGASFPGLTMKLPPSYGVGASWRPSDEWLVSMDLTRVEWSEYRVSDNAGNEFLVTGDPVGEGEVDATHTLRLGAERLFLLRHVILAIRGGAFYDPEPSRGAPDDVYGGSLGLGLTVPNLSVDLAYQFRIGRNVSSPILVDRLFGLDEASVDFTQHFLFASIVYYL